MEKQLSGVEPLWISKVEWGRASVDLQGRSHSVSQVDGFSDMAPAYQLCVGGGLSNGTMASAHDDVRHFRFSQVLTGTLHTVTMVLELRGSKSE